MDTTQDQKAPKRKSGPGLEKSSLGKATKGSKSDERPFIVIDGKLITMEEDLVDLPEADYDDPEIQAMIQEDLDRWEKKFGRLTSEQVEELAQTREKILSSFPDLTAQEATDRAWQEIRPF